MLWILVSRRVHLEPNRTGHAGGLHPTVSLGRDRMGRRRNCAEVEVFRVDTDHREGIASQDTVGGIPRHRRSRRLDGSRS